MIRWRFEAPTLRRRVRRGRRQTVMLTAQAIGGSRGPEVAREVDPAVRFDRGASTSVSLVVGVCIDVARRTSPLT